MIGFHSASMYDISLGVGIPLLVTPYLPIIYLNSIGPIIHFILDSLMKKTLKSWESFLNTNATDNNFFKNIGSLSLNNLLPYLKLSDNDKEKLKSFLR